MLSGMALQVAMEQKNEMDIKEDGEEEEKERYNDEENTTKVEKMDDSKSDNHVLEANNDINSNNNIVP